MKGSEITLPGVYWFFDDDQYLVPGWRIIEVRRRDGRLVVLWPGAYSDRSVDDLDSDGQVVGPIEPPASAALAGDLIPAGVVIDERQMRSEDENFDRVYRPNLGGLEEHLAFGAFLAGFAASRDRFNAKNPLSDLAPRSLADMDELRGNADLVLALRRLFTAWRTAPYRIDLGSLRQP